MALGVEAAGIVAGTGGAVTGLAAGAARRTARHRENRGDGGCLTPARRWSSSLAGALSGRRAGGDPVLEGGDVLWRPGPVAGHRAVAEALEDRALVRLDIAVGPEIEGFEHRVAVLLAEQGTDIMLEARPRG